MERNKQGADKAPTPSPDDAALLARLDTILELARDPVVREFIGLLHRMPPEQQAREIDKLMTAPIPSTRKDA